MNPINPSPRTRGYLGCDLSIRGNGRGRHGVPKHDRFDTVAALCVEDQKLYQVVRKHIEGCDECDPEQAVRAYHSNRFEQERILLASGLARDLVRSYKKRFHGHPYADGGPAAFTTPEIGVLIRDFSIFGRDEALLECLSDLTDEELRKVLLLHWFHLQQSARRDARRAQRERREPGRRLTQPAIVHVLRQASHLPPAGRKLLALFEAAVRRSDQDMAALAAFLPAAEMAALTEILDDFTAAEILQS